ncbi:MAG: DUF2232 domain-containing protein [Clostridia bacterium]|nr:DUF2232 domain-containing protein [Clostridia bacterium]
MKTHSPGKVIGACVVALIAGLLQPFGLAFSVLCVFGTILTPVFFAWAGPAPALAYLGASLCSLATMWGMAMAAAGLLLFALPAGAVIALMIRRAPYFARLRAAVGAQLASLLALVLILYAGLGRSLVDVLMEAMTAWADELPAPLVTIMLQQFALTGALDAESGSVVLSGALTAEQSLAALHEILEQTGEALRLTLPAMLVSSGIITGILATALPGKICARRGDDPEYVPVSGWHVPVRLTLGALVALVTAYALNWAQVNGAESVLIAVLRGVHVIYMVAGVAALSRRFKEMGRSTGFRVVMIGLPLLFVPTLVMVIGVCSALFGRQGHISGYIRKKAGERDKEDDDL